MTTPSPHGARGTTPQLGEVARCFRGLAVGAGLEIECLAVKK